MEETSSTIPRFHVEGHVARITLARPAHRNRLHNEDLVTLHDLFCRLNDDRTIRVVVLGAEVLPQRPVFCAGHHIGDFDAGPSPISLEDVALALERVRAVTVCALNGSVYGGATDFPLACDVALGVDGIEMRVPASALGLHYHPSGLVRYVSRLGVSATKRAFLTAEPLDAQTMLRIGYLQELWPAHELDARVDALVAQISKLSPLALDAHKQSLSEIARGDFHVERLKERFDRLMASDDFAEGRRAFAERRAPIWKGC